MTVSNDPDVLQQPSWWPHLRLPYFRRYLVTWILSITLALILLQLLFLSEITFPFWQSAGSPPISLETEENVSPFNSASSPASLPDMKRQSAGSPPISPPISLETEENVSPFNSGSSPASLPDVKRQSAGSPPISLEPEENVSPSNSESSPASVPDMKAKTNPDSDQRHDATPAGECDLFEGEWEHDPEGPLYTNSTCPYIDENQDCMSNGRPDTDYLYWKWKPRGCDLPRFDAKSFLGSFRGKAIGFVGDSIARNQMQSLLCLLSQIETPNMTYESTVDQSVRWLFKEHQVIVALLNSHYLLNEEDGKVKGFQNGERVLYWDVLDTAWTSVMQDFDVLVFTTGQWYYRPLVYVKEERVVGCHNCPGLNLTDVDVSEAYKAGIREVLKKVFNEFKGVAIISTFPIAHFEHGAWDEAGYCKRKQPLQPEETGQVYGEHMKLREIVMKEFNDVVGDNREQNNDARLEILDVTKVSLQRADGHPGPYRFSPSKKTSPDVDVPNDCLHWCLPGPTEAWNQVVAKILGKYF